MQRWPLVGRDTEIAVVRRALDERRTVLVEGPAGIGKSQLVRTVLEDVDPTRLARHRASPGAAALPYEGLAYLLPEALATGASDRSSLVNEALAHLAASAIDTVWIDDVPHLDDETMVVLFHAVERGMVRLALTARSGLAHPAALVALEEAGAVDTVALRPLDDDAVEAVLVSALEGHVARPTARRLAARSGGNPLLLRELVRAAVADDSLRDDTGVWRWDAADDPDDDAAVGVTDLALRHTRELTPAATVALECLALAGRLDDAAVRRLADPAVADELLSEGLVVADDGGWQVSHPLFGEVAVAALADDDRAARYRALAAAAATTSGRPLDRLRLLRWRRAAGEDIPGGELLDGATIALGVFDTDTAIDLAGAALDAGRTRAATTLAMALTYAGRLDEATPVLEVAVDTARDEGSRVMASITQTLNQAYRDGFTDEIADRHAALEASLAGPELADLVRSERASALAFAGRFAEALELAEPVVADESVAPWTALAYVPAFGGASSTRGRTGPVLEHLGRLTVTAEPFVGRNVAWLHAFRSQALLLHGRMPDAEEAIGRFEELAHLAMVPGVAAVLHAESRGVIALWRGDVAAARALLTEAVALSNVPESNFRRVIPLGMLAVAHALGGDAAAARDAAAEARCAADRFRLGAGYAELGSAWAIAVGGDLTGAAKAAAAATDRLVEADAASPALWCAHDALRFAPSPRTAALVTRVAPLVDGEWSRAFAAHADARASGDPDALLAAAGELAALGAHLHAGEVAAAAAAKFAADGRRAPAAEAREESRRQLERCTGIGLHLGAPTADPVLASLTSREREVATLAAAGLTNAEIAARLGLSVRTSEGHLHRAMGKLDVVRRADLAAVPGIGDGGRAG